MSSDVTTQGHACATCSDRVDTGVVVSLDGRDAEVRLDDGSVVRAAVDLIDGVAIGARVIIHQGVAIGEAGERVR